MRPLRTLGQQSQIKSPSSHPYSVVTTLLQSSIIVVCGRQNTGMAVIREQDLGKGRAAFEQWQETSHRMIAEQYCRPTDDGTRFPAQLLAASAAPAVGDGGALLATSAGEKAPGEGVEVRVAPWGAIKILDGPASDPHNLTPPDVIELEPDVWMRLATGITSWGRRKRTPGASPPSANATI